MEKLFQAEQVAGFDSQKKIQGPPKINEKE